MNPDLDLNNWLESVWSLDFFEDMRATNNAVMQDQIFKQIASTCHLESVAGYLQLTPFFVCLLSIPADAHPYMEMHRC